MERDEEIMGTQCEREINRLKERDRREKDQWDYVVSAGVEMD
jgi:hypothetical protein